MKLHLSNTEQIHVITSCSKIENRYQIVVNDNTYSSSLILTPDKLELWKIDDISDLDEADFVKLASLDAEVVVLGTGDNIVFLKPAITRPLIAKGIGIEVMDTAAACRTYNILLGDSRRVAAGLIL